jgi:hypothetical protein
MAMSLKWFHIIFVTLAVLTCWGFAAWCLLVQGSGGYIVMGIVSALLGAALVVYGVKFWQKLKQVQK